MSYKKKTCMYIYINKKIVVSGYSDTHCRVFEKTSKINSTGR